MIDLYRLLGISSVADNETIRRAYRRASKTAHPDAGGSAEAFEQIKLAHDCLLDPDRRAHYDRTGDPGASKTEDVRGTLIAILAQAQAAAIAEMVKRGIAPHQAELGVEMRAWFRAQFDGIAKQREALAKMRDRDKALLGRWSVVDGETNLMEGILASQIESYEINERGLDLARKQLIEAQDLLEKFAFRRDMPRLVTSMIYSDPQLQMIAAAGRWPS